MVTSGRVNAPEGISPFLNRVDELAALEDMWREPGGRLFVLWGRRRVGKTELLSQFAESRPSLYFEAIDTTPMEQLRSFSSELASVHPGSVLASQPATNWSAALSALEQLLRGGERYAVVLDEFQYLAKRDPSLATTLNVWWRKVGRELPLMLILAGSEVSFFREDVLAGSMYGRRDGQLALHPFDVASSALFTPRYSAEDRVRTFAICGGMPYYLAHWDDSVSVADNILRRILNRDGMLHEEAELLLRQELPDPQQYAAILAAIASGSTRNNEIANHTGLDRAQVYQHLKTLERLQLVGQGRPVTASSRSKKTSYSIRDGFLGFHFRFVAPYTSRLRSREEARRHLDNTVLPALDEFVAKPAWERICQEYVFRSEPEAVSVGAWWGNVQTAPKHSERREVDIVALDHHRRVIATGSCKWTLEPLSRHEEAVLAELEPHIVDASGVDIEGLPRHYFFSRSGFTDGMHRLVKEDPSRIRLLAPEDIYSPPRASRSASSAKSE